MSDELLVVDTSSLAQVRQIEWIGIVKEKVVFARLTKLVEADRLVYPPQVVDELAQYKTKIATAAEEELKELADKNGWGLGNFQIAIGDPSMSEELKRLLMREEAVKRENAANLERARNQLEVTKQLANVSSILDGSPVARELLRLQMIADMGAGGKVVVLDTKTDLTVLDA